MTAGIKVLERMAGKGKGSKADDEYRLVQVRTTTRHLSCTQEGITPTPCVGEYQCDRMSQCAIPALSPYITASP